LGKHDYIYAPRNIELCPGQTLRDFSFSTTASINVSLTLFFLNSTGEKLGHTTLHSGRMRDLCLPQGTERVRIALCIAGPGTTALTRISMNNATSAAFAVCGTSPYLLLTNRYPSHADLYKNAFVHRRVVQYQKHGVRPDVFQFRANVPPGYHEFEGVTATTGYTAELQVLLASHPYKAILVHFLEPDMWAALKPLLPPHQSHCLVPRLRNPALEAACLQLPHRGRAAKSRTPLGRTLGILARCFCALRPKPSARFCFAHAGKRGDGRLQHCTHSL
jgi:hypothetical protein